VFWPHPPVGFQQPHSLLAAHPQVLFSALCWTQRDDRYRVLEPLQVGQKNLGSPYQHWFTYWEFSLLAKIQILSVNFLKQYKMQAFALAEVKRSKMMNIFKRLLALVQTSDEVNHIPWFSKKAIGTVGKQKSHQQKSSTAESMLVWAPWDFFAYC